MTDQIPHTNHYVVAALYKFVVISSPPELQQTLKEKCSHLGLMGTLLIAPEGLNGTISGSFDGITRFVNWLRAQSDFADIDIKYSAHDVSPFHRMRVRLKREIVTMGREDIIPSEQSGTYVEPEDWNRLISDPDVLVVDTRNDYEVAIGAFKGADNPQTRSFREFPDYAEKLADLAEEDRPKRVAMYCTGGIRCEKSTSLMKQLGFDEVYHLKGGILRYLEDIPQSESLWEGECFVFDGRVSVGHDLKAGQYQLCHACKMPLSAEDLSSETYEPSISCPHCHDKTTEAQKQRFAERKRQVELARARGEVHIGQHAPAARKS